jgi:hypothetical protein
MFSMKHKSVRGLVVSLFIAFSANLANAAINFDNTSSASSSTDGATLSWSHTIGSGSNRMLIVGVCGLDTSTSDLVISSVKYNGASMSFVSGSSVTLTTSTSRKTELYYMLNSDLPAAGTYTVTVTYSGNVTNRSAGAISLTGVAQQAREAVATTSTGTVNSTTISTDITTLTNGAWVVDIIGSGSAGSFTTTTSGMTKRYDVTAASSSAAGSTKPVEFAGTTTMSWEQTSAYRLVHSVAAFAKAEEQQYPTGDLNHDWKVDWLDLDLFADQWLAPAGCPGNTCADFSGDGDVDFIDFAMLATNWTGTPAPADPVINEFMAANSSTIADNYGDYDDWIEIYNPGSVSINIGGMYITDDLNNPDKWHIPANAPTQTTIPAHGYLILWADSEPCEGPTHLGFNLSKDGEAVGLSRDGLTLIDGIEFGKQTSNISFGRYPDGANSWRFMSTPTPGAQNNAGYLGSVGDVEISHSHGFYDSNFVVELFCDDASATIKYTLDGNTPTDTVGLTYNPSVRIPITGTTCLRAAAFRTGYKPSSVSTATYIFLNGVRNQSNTYAYSKGFPAIWMGWDNVSYGADYGMDPDVLNDPCYSSKFTTAMKSIPTMSIVTDMANLFGQTTGIYVNPWATPADAWERPASLEYFDPCSGADFQINAGLRMAGQISRNPGLNYKHGLRFFFKSEYGPSSLDFPLFQNTGASQLQNLTLRSNYQWSWLDTSWNGVRAQYLRDTFAQDTLRDMGWLSPDARFVHLYINGLYWGIYQASERPDDGFLAAHLGGQREDYDVVEGAIGGTADIELKSGMRDSWDYMRSLLAPFSYNNPATASVYAEFAQHVDVNQFCDYIIYNTFVTNWDWGSKNWYAGSTRNPLDVNGPPLDKWLFFTWDAECSIWDYTQFHTFPFSDYYDKGPGNIHNALHNNPVYNRILGDRVQKHLLNNGALTAQKNIDRYQIRAEQIKNAVLGESARWGDFIHDFKDANFPTFTPASWDNERDRLVNPSHPIEEGWIGPYFPNRTTWLLANSYKTYGFYPSVAAPTFSQFGGEITAGGTVAITVASGGTIYYTTDGREPNGYGTIIASGGTVTINNSLTLKARAYYSSSSKWSALNEATFAVGPVKDKLRITELMYHPTEPGDPCQEFIELKNIGTTTLNLNLVKFTDGIHFTFPNMTLTAGDYVLVVENINAFVAKYGSGKNVAGQYTGNLSNAGEHIRLEDAIGRTIHDFNYSDGWEKATDGEGFSLNIFDVNADVNTWNNAESWSASKYAGGTPDTDDPSLLKKHSIVINELMAHAAAGSYDWIELKNTTSASINIGNWYLSDDIDNPTKYRIKPGTILAPGAYLVLSADANFGPLSTDPGNTTAFVFSEYGETACLTSSDGTVLTGYREKEDFGASERGIAFGRYQKSTGTYNFVPMSSNTPGAANAYPKVGPVVINEIMYNPPDLNGQNSEYIELKNITGSTVNLYDVNGVPWEFSDGIDYVFPASTTIPANGYLLVVKTTPAYFRTRYTVPSGVTVLGPYNGNLSNASETLELVRPTDTDESGQTVYTRVDRVVYSDGSHPADCPEGVDLWPTQADGGGKSLSRKVITAYGNDPNNWQAANPTPGTANP